MYAAADLKRTFGLSVFIYLLQVGKILHVEISPVANAVVSTLMMMV